MRWATVDALDVEPIIVLKDILLVPPQDATGPPLAKELFAFDYANGAQCIFVEFNTKAQA